ncbi:low-density lipoprotein receptor-related protein 2-like isoform X2 [Tigriopus californicus]|uniref:low-density lipoprotein receptor-related protein 2-like isoform X2 n=1 Tax=Tigriopus californicus TaxID=6832 RepID=UPI0027DA1224|nr:low-density lipoprotein receptor-related protein 2-like isoform X2 [Tigriopus californicus]
MQTVWNRISVSIGLLCLVQICAFTGLQAQATWPKHPECSTDDYPILWGNLDRRALPLDFAPDQLLLKKRWPIPLTQNQSQTNNALSICVKEDECLSGTIAQNTPPFSLTLGGSPFERSALRKILGGNWICQSRCLLPYEPCYENGRPICKSNRKEATKNRLNEGIPLRQSAEVCNLEDFGSNAQDQVDQYKLKPEIICLISGMSCNRTCAWDSDRPLRADAGIDDQTVCVAYCDRLEEWQCQDKCIQKTMPCGEACPTGYWLCQNENKCIPLRWVCDGSRLLGCSDGSDEIDCSGCADGMRQCGDKLLCKTRGLNLPCGPNRECSIGYERCSDSLCVTHRQACNATCLREGMLPCGHQCYEIGEKCDGVANCGNREDELDCGTCQVGSKKCGDDILCRDQSCPADQEADPDQDLGRNLCKTGDCAQTEEECDQYCDHYWCASEARCISRIDNLQGCNDLREHPSVGNAIFVNASCVPDAQGQCPTSVRVSESATKLWVKCGNACWTKFINHEPGKIPQRYQMGLNEVDLTHHPRCHAEEFTDLCRGRCKFYDAWFCGDRILCTNVPCQRECPAKAGPKQEKFYLCDDECIPESLTCQNKCRPGRFRCGSQCLSTPQVCDGKRDCFDGSDEDPSFCQGCRVGQTLCQGQPICLDQICEGKCLTREDGHVLIDCGFEGSDRNICAPRESLCNEWMEKRYGVRTPF